MTIRPATSDDLPTLLELELLGFGAEAYPHELVEAGVPDSILCTVDDEVVGYAQVGVIGHLADLHRIVVRPDARRAGHGRALLDASLAWAGERGAHRLLLEVREHNDPALELYRAAGMSMIDRRRRYYHDGTDALVLEARL